MSPSRSCEKSKERVDIFRLGITVVSFATELRRYQKQHRYPMKLADD